MKKFTIKTVRFIFDDREFPIKRLRRELTYVFDCDPSHLARHGSEERYFILPTLNYGNVMFFHSGDKPNMEMLNDFLYRKSKGLVRYFVCCDPENIPAKYRRFHLAGDCYGEVRSYGKLEDTKDPHVHIYKVTAKKRIA